MKILYFYQYFSSPKGSWGTRVYEFTKEWVDKGHDVTVITSVYSKSDIKVTKFIEDLNIDGIHVKVINIKHDNKVSFVKRLWGFISFSFIATYYAIKLKSDVTIASSGPISIGLPGMISKLFRRSKFVFEVRDLWPDGAIQLGILKNKYLIKFAYWFEKLCYSYSDLVITLSPGMTEFIAKKQAVKRIDDVTNSANIDLFGTPVAFNAEQLKSKKYAIYTGNIGSVNNSFWLYEAALKLKQIGREDIHIVLIGEGQEKEEIANLKLNNKVDNLIILDLMSKENLVGYVQNAIVSLVPLKNVPVLRTSSPNKFFESLAAGVPVIQTTDGWMKDFLDKLEVGFTLNPDNPEELADKLIWMSDNEPFMEKMAIRAKIVAKEKFDKNVLAAKMLKHLSYIHSDK